MRRDRASAAPGQRLGDAPVLIACSTRPGWNLQVKFADGVGGTFCLENLVEAGVGVFRWLRDPEAFARVRPDPGGRAVLWSVGVRLDGVTLYQDLRARGILPAAPGDDQGFQRFMAKALGAGGLADGGKGGGAP